MINFEEKEKVAFILDNEVCIGRVVKYYPELTNPVLVIMYGESMYKRNVDQVAKVSVAEPEEKAEKFSDEITLSSAELVEACEQIIKNDAHDIVKGTVELGLAMFVSKLYTSLFLNDAEAHDEN